MLNHISSQCNKSFILSLSRQDPLMVDCYTDYYFSDNSEGTGTASLIADHNILTTMSFIYTEREKKINQNKYVSKMESSTTLTHY